MNEFCTIQYINFNNCIKCPFALGNQHFYIISFLMLSENESSNR